MTRGQGGSEQTPIAGRYRPLRVLGRGGNGVVYEATDLHLDRRVAVKASPRSTSSRPAPPANAHRRRWNHIQVCEVLKHALDLAENDLRTRTRR